MYYYSYAIDGIYHKIQSTTQLLNSDKNGTITISKSDNDIFSQLKFILREWIKLADKNNIKWFCTAGTLLGVIRDKGFIHYDNDVDLAVFIEDYNTILNLKSDTCVVSIGEQGFQMCLKDKPFPFIDLWIYAKNPTNSDELILAAPYLNNRPLYLAHIIWPNDKYQICDTLDIKQLLFEDIIVNVPANSEKNLKQLYGDDCLLRYVVYDHTENHALIGLIPRGTVRMAFWNLLLELLNQDKKLLLFFTLLGSEAATPSKNKMNHRLEVIYRFLTNNITI